jgi:hypothetical protein
MTERTVWFAESPMFPGYYLRKEPRHFGKLGENVELGTYSWNEAREFLSRQECENWIRSNHGPEWIPTEHGVPVYSS